MRQGTDIVPVDTTQPQLTLRGVLTGMVLGGTLSLCNIYVGLKVGWGMNMSVTAVLIGFGFWGVLGRVAGTSRYGVLENNLAQTAASAGASIASAGLSAAVPAYTLLTGEKLGYVQLTVWLLSVAWVGVIVGAVLRRQMIVVDNLPFPGGVATGKTLQEIYAHGEEAMARVKMLGAGAAAGIITKVGTVVWSIKHAVIPGALPASGALAGKGVTSITLQNLGWTIDPSIMFVAVGGIIGFRTCAWILVGGVIAWGGLAPWVLANGWAEAGAPDKPWFSPVVKWMLWPAVSLMVVGSLTSFLFSWRSLLSAFNFGGGSADKDSYSEHEVPMSWVASAVAVVTVGAATCQVLLFDVSLPLAVLAVPMALALSVVAGRVSGETGVTPVGAMGKVTQLTFGVLDPGNVASNLMAANVTGGAASQCGDLLHDLKTGSMLGASPRAQAISQACGVLAGAVCGAAGYLVLIPDPQKMLLTDDWPAPAVQQWKAVAEVFKVGLSGMPTGAFEAMMVCAVIAVVLTFAEKFVPKPYNVWVPSPIAIGLAMSLPAYNSLSFFVGGLLMFIGQRVAPAWIERFAIVLAAGVVAGESLAGVGDALYQVFGGGGH